MMKQKTMTRILAVIMALCMLTLSACTNANVMTETNGVERPVIGNPADDNILLDSSYPTQSKPQSDEPMGKYNEGVVLVKYEGELNEGVL